MLKRGAILISCIFGLSGCSGNLDQLKELKPAASDFPSSLASEYLAYADSEAEQGRIQASDHFAEKGLKSAKGENVAPDMPSDNMLVDTHAKFISAREMLMAVLTDDVKRVNPQSAARAQLLYDCWLSQQSRMSRGELMPCADEFRSSLDEVQKIADLFVHGKEAVHEIEFDSGSAVLSEKSNHIISKIAKHVKRVTNYAVEIEAFEVEQSDVARALSDARINAVKQALVTSGVLESAIKEKGAFSAKAVIIGDDVVKADVIEITVRAYSVPGGR